MQVQEIGRRGGCSMTTLNGQLVLIGGASRQKEFKDIHLVTLDGSGSSRKLSIFRQATSQEVISERHAMGTCEVSPSLTLLFGGQSFVMQSHYDSMLSVSMEQDKVKLSVLSVDPKNAPSARNSAGMCVDKKNQRLFIYGGADNEGVKHDLFTFDIE